MFKYYSRLVTLGLFAAGVAQAGGPQITSSTRALQRPADSAKGVAPDSRPVTVVVKLAGDPVAVVRSRTATKTISAADQAAIEKNLSAQQDALISSIQGQGGRVLAKFQNALNGIKVQIPANRVAALAALPGVVGVKRVAVHNLLNATSVPFIGADAVWGASGLHGEHIKIAIIDTGVDYTHANFGGPGTVAAYQAALATDTLAPDPTLVGPAAPKVKGGIDLVGDAYDANVPGSIPMPDPNPLDCNGHGSHTSGTATGFGVLANGTTFQGPYDFTTPTQQFLIGPGVAPLADLYAVRVFGCSGSTNVVADAVDWSVKNGMQVISMSLGSPFGTEDSADAEASENAANAGVIVVAAAGNEGPAPYITGDPATGDKVISVGAMDTKSPASFPGATLALTPGGTVVAQNSNGATIVNGTTLPVVVLRDASGAVSLGCSESEYVDAQIAGKLVVTLRGTCPRVDRATFGQKHGAAAVAMINNGPGYPPFEGTLAGVTLPFLGVLPSDGPALVAASTATLSNTSIADPAFHGFASFSSGGPRGGDALLKPDITGPGVNIVSTAMGTGTQGVAFSGTSMATPHVAGVAALALQAHPDWSPDAVRTAILNTADASVISHYDSRLGGSGLVEAFPATRTSVIARDEHRDAANLSFGVVEFDRDFRGTRDLIVRNLGDERATFTVSSIPGVGAAHTVTFDRSNVSIAAHGQVELHVTLHVPVAGVGDSSAFRQVSGLVTLSPTADKDDNTLLSIPYFQVPRARSRVESNLRGDFGPNAPTAHVRVHNESHAVAGTADFYAWGLKGTNSALGSTGLRAVGVQSFADPTLGEIMVFAVNTFAPFSSAATKEFDILIDANNDGTPDFVLFSADVGLVTTGTSNGQVASFVQNLSTGALTTEFLVTAPNDGTSVLIPVIAADVGVTAANPRFTYGSRSFDLFGTDTDVLASTTKFNAFQNALSTGAFAQVAPGVRTEVAVQIDPTEWQNSPALGLMIVGLENFTRHTDERQATLIKVPHD